MKNPRTACTIALFAFLLWGGSSVADAQGKFTVHPKEGFAIKLDGVPVALPRDPKEYAETKLIHEERGFTVIGKGIRKEYAIFEDRLEYTFDFYLPAPGKQALSVLLPLPKGAAATVRHGRTHPAPPPTMVYRAGDISGGKELKYDEIGPAAPDVGGAKSVFPLRYVTIKAPAYTLSVDTHPGGANSEDPSYAESPLRTTSCRQIAQGAEIIAKIPRGYAAYGGRVKGKFIFYANGRPFEEVHPFAFANEYSALEKYLHLDFSNRPQRRKSDPVIVGADPFDAEKRYGWVGDAADVSVVSTKLGAMIYGAFATSEKPATFRISAPPGYYYLTLNAGSADGATGPFRISVNGEERVKRVALEKGRFKNELVLVKTTSANIDVLLEGLDGGSWVLNGLAVEPLGTLNEDFVFTRPWWHFAH